MKKTIVLALSATLLASCSTEEVKQGAEDLYQTVMPRAQLVDNGTQEQVIAKDQASFNTTFVEGSHLTTAKASSATRAAVSGLKDAGVQFTLRFDYDNFEISQANTDEIIKHANFMRDNPSLKLRLEGHADERGTREYNLALGENRALAVKEVLSLYELSSRVDVISYGEEKPLIDQHDEKAYQQNRRVDFVYE